MKESASCTRRRRLYSSFGCMCYSTNAISPSPVLSHASSLSGPYRTLSFYYYLRRCRTQFSVGQSLLALRTFQFSTHTQHTALHRAEEKRSDKRDRKLFLFGHRVDGRRHSPAPIRVPDDSTWIVNPRRNTQGSKGKFAIWLLDWRTVKTQARQ